MEATPLTASQELDILANFGHLSDDDDEVSVNLILSSEDEILSDSEDDYLICVDTDEEEEELETEGNQGGGSAIREKTVSNDNGEKEPFTIRCIGHQDAPRFGTTQTSYTVNFDQEYLDNAHQSANPDQALAHGMDLMIRRIGIMQDLAPGDRISITISHPELDVDVRIPFVRFEHMVSNLLLSAVDHVAQSKTNFCFDMGIKIKVTVVRNPDNVGSGRGVGRTTRRNTKTVREFLKNRRSLLLIQNKDDLCLGRAIATALFIVQEKPDRSKRRQFVNDGYERQRDAALELYRAAGVQPRACDEGRATLDKFQTHLLNTAVLHVHSLTPGGGPTLIYKGCNVDRTDLPSIHVLCHEGHYDVNNSVKGFYGTLYYCTQCDKGLSDLKTHPCTREYSCSKCHQTGVACTPGDCNDAGTACHSCDVWFPSRECFNRHLAKDICKTFKMCQICKKPRKKDHNCSNEDRKCKRCGDMLGEEHRCYIPVATDDKQYDYRLAKYVYYDFETMTDQDGKHIPNLCVIQLACGVCGGDKSSFLCEHCPWKHEMYSQFIPRDCKREIVFSGPDTLSQLGGFLSKLIPPTPKFGTRDYKKKKRSTSTPQDGEQPPDILLIAHYAKGFDNHFILKTLLDQLVEKPNVTMVGGKILDMTVEPLKFRDSHNYIPTPLKKFSATFELEDGEKGYFPHLFNTVQNQGVKLATLPPPTYYDPDSMSTKDRQAFMDWYGVHKTYPFDLQQQLLTYCIQDVSILRRGCSSFINSFLELTDINPFYECLTLPMACMTTYRRHFMQPQTLAIVPPQGYENTQSRRSKIADEWLASLERINQFNLERETAIKCGSHTYKVDALDPITKVVYEFLGCWYHGCKRCYPSKRDRLVHYGSGTTIADRFEKTMFRLASLQESPKVTRIVIKWECEYKSDRDPQDFIPEGIQPLKARDAFYGGRTNGIQLHKKCSTEEKIRYVDVCSLYPFICKYGKFPVGHPRVIHNPAIDRVFEFDGIIQCEVLPPTRLFHPLLPYRTNQKLYFPLCKTCADRNLNDECTHSDGERAWVGTFTTIEVQRAVKEFGYTLRSIYDVWHYDKFEQYDRETNREGLFSRYVDSFYKLKQEASGYPVKCDTPEKRADFVREVFLKEGVSLDSEKIVNNPGKRSLAKNMLNSHWGKLGQTNDKRATVFLDREYQLYNLFYDQCVVIHDLEIINENILLVSKSLIEQHETPHTASNPVIAAWVTAQARLKLYEVLNLLDIKCLYFDTDSVIFLDDDNTPHLPLGDSLGQWTDEIEEGNWIEEFATCGPKNYAYKLHHQPKEGSREICKIRGFTLNSRTSAALNFDALVQTATQHKTDPVTIDVQFPNQLKRAGLKRKLDIHTVHQTKTYKFCYNKRRIVAHPITGELVYTVPYGFKTSRG